MQQAWLSLINFQFQIKSSENLSRLDWWEEWKIEINCVENFEIRIAQKYLHGLPDCMTARSWKKFVKIAKVLSLNFWENTERT